MSDKMSGWRGRYWGRWYKNLTPDAAAPASETPAPELGEILERARAAAQAGDKGALKALVDVALPVAGGGVASLLELGAFARDFGLFDEAQNVCRKVMRENPDEPRAVLDFGYVCLNSGRHSDAIGPFRDYLGRHYNSHLARVLARILYLCGAINEADNLIASLRADPDALKHGMEVHAFGRYVDVFGLSAARAMLDRVHRRVGHAEPSEVADRILAAKAERRPFALIRLGDGEGACIRLDPGDEASYGPIYAQNRQEMISIWFGPEIDSVGSGFDRLCCGLSDLVAECDLVGIPYPSWIEHEFRIGSVRGIPSILNVLRLLDRDAERFADTTTCTQQIHIDLGQREFFDPLLRGEDIGVVSCFAELGPRLQERFGVRSVDFHKLPGERMSAALIGEEAVAGRHYPDVFEATMERLSQPHHGRIFLVAGGILGKFYARQIRRNGGIALDIGSLADGWLAKGTRPGQDMWTRPL